MIVLNGFSAFQIGILQLYFEAPTTTHGGFYEYWNINVKFPLYTYN